jgi:hypothetical protein
MHHHDASPGADSTRRSGGGGGGALTFGSASPAGKRKRLFFQGRARTLPVAPVPLLSFHNSGGDECGDGHAGGGDGESDEDDDLDVRRQHKRHVAEVRARVFLFLGLNFVERRQWWAHAAHANPVKHTSKHKRCLTD